jgi:hypothetical protein
MSKEEYTFEQNLDLIAFSLILYVAVSVTGIEFRQIVKDD